jgi:hypothetical protein
MLPFRSPKLFGIMDGNTCVGRHIGVRRMWELRSRDEGLFPPHTG